MWEVEKKVASVGGFVFFLFLCVFDEKIIECCASQGFKGLRNQKELWKGAIGWLRMAVV